MLDLETILSTEFKAYRQSQKLDPNKLHGLCLSRNTQSTGNIALDAIRTANPGIMAASLADHCFLLEKYPSHAIYPMPTTTLGKQVYNAAIPSTDYSLSFQLKFSQHICDFSERLKPQQNWSGYTIRQKAQYMNYLNRRLWATIDPKGELSRARNKNFEAGKKNYPVIRCRTQNPDHNTHELVKSLANLHGMDKDQSILSFQSVLHGHYFGKDAGCYQGIGQDTISIDFERSAFIRLFDISDYPDWKKSPEEPTNDQVKKVSLLFQENFGLDRKPSAQLTDNLQITRRNQYNYYIKQNNQNDFQFDMKTFFHEQAHRSQYSLALYFERTGHAPFGFTLEDYELTKLSIANYDRPEKNDLNYANNLLEVNARETAAMGLLGMSLSMSS